MIANQLFESEVREKSVKRYERQGKRYSRWGSNPGSVRIGEERVNLLIPRLLNKLTGRTEGIENYKKLRASELPSEPMLKKILFGLSQRNYGEVSRLTSDSFVFSQSSVSRGFIEASEKALAEFETRDLSKYDFIGLVIEGKYLHKEQVVIGLGVTIEGDKIPLGFIHSTTENSIAIKVLLRDLLKRNFKYSKGIFAITDGSRGIIKSLKEVFGKYVLHQRCVWHKRENVVSYLKTEEQVHYRGNLQRAYREPEYTTAKKKLYEIRAELKKVNRSASNSLEEGLEQTLTLHKLGLVEELGKSLMTTSIIEWLNSQLATYLRKVNPPWRIGLHLI